MIAVRPEQPKSSMLLVLVECTHCGGVKPFVVVTSVCAFVCPEKFSKIRQIAAAKIFMCVILGYNCILDT